MQNFVSRNVSVVNLSNDQVIKTIRTTRLPAPGSTEETVLVGAEMFFSSRGHFSGPGQPTSNRLSSEGWQNCASCHFKGLTDGIVWSFGDGPRKSIPLNSTFNPANRNDQRILNYTPVRDEVEDFDLNIRNVSGPGPLAAAIACANPPPPPALPTSTLDPNHGLIIGDNGSVNQAPCVINNFALPNANRQQVTVTLPGSTTQVPANTALREWVRLAVRTPNAPLTKPKVKTGRTQATINKGRTLFIQAGCAGCHGGTNWTISSRNFTPPPAGATIFTERTPAQVLRQPGRQPVPERLPAEHRLVQPRRGRRAQPDRRQRRRGREGERGVQRRRRRPAAAGRARASTTTTTAAATASTRRRCSA